MKITILFILVSCAGAPPRMERKVRIWNGAPEENGICRMSSAELREKSHARLPLFLLKRFHQGTTGYECLPANDESFKQYACLTFADLGVINAYIEKLIYSCKKWQ